MSRLEDRLRDAYQAAAQTVSEESFRGLGERIAQRDHNRQAQPVTRRGRVIIPLTAAAAVAAIAVAASLAVPQSQAGRGRPAGNPRPTSSASGPTPIAPDTAGPPPPFFIGINWGKSDIDLGVFNSSTGRLVSRLAPRDGQQFTATAATGDSRAFIVATAARTGPCQTRLYQLRLTAQGQVAGLAPLAVPQVRGDIQAPSELAASANGQVIAYAARDCGGEHGWAGVIDLATGRVRTWPASSWGLFSMSLSPAGTLAGFVDTTAFGGNGTAQVLSTGAPPGPLEQRARTVLPASVVTAEGTAVLSASGKAMLACAESGRNATLSAYSVATGRLLRILHSWRHVLGGPCMLSVASGSRFVLVSGLLPQDIATRIDVITGQATPVPGSPAERTAVGIAW